MIRGFLSHRDPLVRHPQPSRAAESIRWWLTAFELALFPLAAALILRRRLAIRPHPIAILLAIAALWALIQFWLNISVDPQRTLKSALGWTVNCAAFSVTLAVCARDEIRRRFLTAQVLFALAVSIEYVIFHYVISTLGPFIYKNQFAAYLESVMGIAITYAIRHPRRRLGWILVAGTMFASVVAAGSRAGSILCLALLVALPVVAAWRGWIGAPDLARIARCGDRQRRRPGNGHRLGNHMAEAAGA